MGVYVPIGSALLSASLASSPTLPSLVVAATGPASEDERAPPSDSAVDAFYRADKLFNEAKYEEALAAFEEADRLHPAPDLQYNIGLCHMQLSNWREAILHFEVYLRTKEDPPDRADVEHRIERAKAAIESEKALADLDRAAEPPAAVAPPPATEREQADDLGPRQPHKPLVISGSVLLGLGAATAIGGAVGFGLVIRGRNQELDDVVDGGNPEGLSFAEAKRKSLDATDLRNAMWITVGIGSAVAVVGASLLAAGLSRRARSRKRLALGPWGTPTGGGLVARGRF